jgi:hypothetical protein
MDAVTHWGPHGGRRCRLRFPGGGPRFLLSAASCLGPARIAGARAGFASGATGPRACPQSDRTRQCAERLTCRAARVKHFETPGMGVY